MVQFSTLWQAVIDVIDMCVKDVSQ